MSKAEKRGVFPTHSAPIPGKFSNNVCVSSLNEPQKSFFPEKRQKEDTPLLNLRAVGMYILVRRLQDTSCIIGGRHGT
jgi:hypothetical protein